MDKSKITKLVRFPSGLNYINYITISMGRSIIEIFELFDNIDMSFLLTDTPVSRILQNYFGLYVQGTSEWLTENKYYFYRYWRA